MGERFDGFPLFPLGLVLLPGEVVPLHIFEERYKLMVNECLDGDSEFGILWLADDGLKDIGCTARVTEVLERADDGRLNILVRGSDPFRLLRRIEELPYPAGDVELLDEDDDGPPLGEAADEAREGYANLIERVTDSRPEEPDLERISAFGMAASLDFALEAKQDLLELRSEEVRMERLRELFGSTIQRIEQAEVSAERARSNGHLRIS